MVKELMPKGFFVTSGVGMENEPLIAFDTALRGAGIGECNLVEVSSILPTKSVELEHYEITPGEITLCVMSRMDGKSGEVIGASIGYGWFKIDEDNSEGRDYGIICEHHGHYSKEYLTEKVQEKLYRMAFIRDKKLIEKKIHVKSAEVEDGKFGSVIVALVFVF